MEHIREYLLSVTAAALICGVIRSLAGKNGIVQLIAGMFLLLVLLHPIGRFSLHELNLDPQKFRQSADSAAAEGVDYAQAAMARHINEQCQAYILDKAKVYDSSITAEFILDDSLTPVGCTLRGEVSAYAKEQLSEVLKADLGISEEAVQWIP